MYALTIASFSIKDNYQSTCQHIWLSYFHSNTTTLEYPKAPPICLVYLPYCWAETCFHFNWKCTYYSKILFWAIREGWVLFLLFSLSLSLLERGSRKMGASILFIAGDLKCSVQMGSKALVRNFFLSQCVSLQPNSQVLPILPYSQIYITYSCYLRLLLWQ